MLGRSGIFLLGVSFLACRPDANIAEEPEKDAAIAEARTGEVPALLADYHAADVSFEGCWKWNWLPGFDSNALCVTSMGDGAFELRFLHSTDYTGPREHVTQARWSGSGWKLREPLEGMAGAPTHVLYPARYEGEECLVPDGGLDRLEEGGPLWGVFHWGGGAPQHKEYAFRRAEDDLVDKMREEWRAFFQRIHDERQERAEK